MSKKDRKGHEHIGNNVVGPRLPQTFFGTVFFKGKKTPSDNALKNPNNFQNGANIDAKSAQRLMPQHQTTCFSDLFQTMQVHCNGNRF